MDSEQVRLILSVFTVEERAAFQTLLDGLLDKRADLDAEALALFERRLAAISRH